MISSAERVQRRAVEPRETEGFSTHSAWPTPLHVIASQCAHWRGNPRPRFLFAKHYLRNAIHLAANALPGPASRRPAKGAAAERDGRLYLPPAAAAFAPPIFFSSCRKEDGPRPGQKKRAPTRWACGAGPGWSSRSSEIVQVRSQSLNRWSPRVPRGAASLGAALGAKRTRFFLCRRGDSRIARSPGRRGRRPLQGKRIATPVTSVT